MIKRGVIATIILMAGSSGLFAQAEPPSQTPGQIPTSLKWYYDFNPEGWRYWSQSSATDWKLAGAMQQIQYAAAAAPAPAAAAPAPSQSSDLYALDKKVAFNVLDQIDYDTQTGKLTLIGHNDQKYKTPLIPYLDYLASFLEHPAPKFSFEWTPDSEARVANLRNQLSSDAEWRRLAREWGTWVDSSGGLTPAGRFFMPLFGIEISDNMDRYQILFSVLAATNQPQAAVIVSTLRDIHLAWPHPSREQLTDFVSATGTYDYAAQLNQQVAAGQLAPAERTRLVYRAIWQNMDNAFHLTQYPLRNAFDAAVSGGQPLDAAFDTAVAAFNRQIGPVAGAALASLLHSKTEIQVPISLVNPSLRDALIVQPKYIDVDGNSLLAKLMRDVDYATKTLVNSPELAGKIPPYQTEFAFRRAHPEAALGGRVLNSRLWISVDEVNAAQSPDGNSLAFGPIHMRINMRDENGGEAEAAYAQELTKIYDELAQSFSPLLHELREAAKLAYAAQWLRARNAALKLPAEGRGSWNGSGTARGVIFTAWSPAGNDVVTISAIGGIDFLIRFLLPSLPKDPDVEPARDVIGAPGVAADHFTLQPPPPAGPAAVYKLLKNLPRLSQQEEEDERSKCEQGAPVTAIPAPELANYSRRGKYGEDALKDFHRDGISQYGRDTIKPGILPPELGTLERKVDLFWNGICMEAKEGYTRPTSSRVQLELQKDFVLRDRNLCKSVEWHFFVSPTTKNCGPSGLLVRNLLALGFRCVKHDDPRVATTPPDCRPRPPLPGGR